MKAEGHDSDAKELALPAPTGVPLYVDLDGTLYPGDTLWDSIALAIQKSPVNMVRLPFVLLSGPLRAKSWLANQVIPDASLLPYRADLVAMCQQERSQGRRVVLATAAHRLVADAVADHLGCFDAVIATETVNCKGSAKLAAICSDTADKTFLYAGDSEPDRAIWRESGGAITAGRAASWNPPKVSAEVLARFPDRHARLKAVIRSLRPYQWVKNVLIFVPLLASHQLLDSRALTASVLVFVAFCLCASSVYLLNDLIDLENDRAHVRKKSRPLAAATLPVTWALAMIPLLLAAAIATAMFTTVGALAWLGVYYVLTLAYSTWLKRKLLVDVFTLAALYAIRCTAGHAATGVPYSPWLLGFMIFLFLSLAFAKRHSELFHVRAIGKRWTKGRGYCAGDLEVITMYGVAAGFMAALVMGLYVTSDAVTKLYRSPMLLWLVCPIVLYWIMRVWLVAHRGDLHDDPIVFALKDSRSQAIAIVAAVVLAAATYLDLGFTI